MCEDIIDQPTEFFEGLRAYALGIRILSCPYNTADPVMGHRAQPWVDGWLFGFKNNIKSTTYA